MPDVPQPGEEFVLAAAFKASVESRWVGFLSFNLSLGFIFVFCTVSDLLPLLCYFL